MSETVIQVENLGKRYVIGQRKQEKYSTLRDAIANGGKSIVQKIINPSKINSSQAEFWALKDISFEINQGDRIGIVGRNGAGKSTLLKILSRITEPTKGRIKLKGRVASLLEVGTGFHPELTGRENIFLNGTILGMTKLEIKQKFDKIVDFAEVEKFLETPVKRYSSGMYVRLAFAIAAHLEPEILIVDEVLAVGDAQFQKKCLGKMKDAGKEGRTILFVTHNMAVLPNLCSRAILLNGGSIAVDDTVSEVVNTYLNLLEKTSLEDLASRTDRRGKGEIRLTNFESFVPDHSAIKNTLVTGLPARFIFHLSQIKPGLYCVFTLYNQYNQPVANFNSTIYSQHDWQNSTGTKISCDIEELLLVPGRYQLNVGIGCNQEIQDHLEAVAIITVEPGILRDRPITKDSRYGSVCLPHVWNFTK